MDIVRHKTTPIGLPAPRVQLDIRLATMADLPFIDALQKAHSKQLGFMHRAALEGKIEAGHVLVAESSETKETTDESPDSGHLAPRFSSLSTPLGPLGYIIGADRYFKRDDVGCIFQLCVVPGQRRGLIGAALVKAMFDRAAYGCRLFCCWCAQDLEANRFWESLGFVPLAYRAGSEKKARVHIFWQKRIREGDETTPWWFPAKTDAGAMREDRLVLPIPPGMHWSDELPVLRISDQRSEVRDQSEGRRDAASSSGLTSPEKPARRPRAHVQFGLPTASPAPQHVENVAPGQKKAPRPKRKADPKLIAAARELRDRWLEEVDHNPALLLPHGKYEVAKALAGSEPLPHGRGSLAEVIEVKALPEAA